MAIEIRVPTLGESVTEATVATWFKKPGDLIQSDEMLCELETDKVTVEVPSPTSGKLQEIIVKEGQTVSVDALLAILSKEDTAQEKDIIKEIENTQVQENNDFKEKDTEDAPSAKKIMLEKNLDPKSITGSGRDGRIMKEDVQNIPHKSNQEKPSSVNAPINDEERIKMSQLRKTIANRLKEAQNTAAILTTYNEVDMSEIKKIRTDYKELFMQKHGVNLGFMSFFIKACSHALLEIPEVNAKIDGEDIVFKKYVNMGVAVGTPNGLVVPVIKNTNILTFAEIEKQVVKLGEKGQDGKLSIQEMQGGTFTISNGGIYGSLMSSPILNPPQSGILGMHKIQERPVAINSEIAVSYTHLTLPTKA